MANKSDINLGSTINGRTAYLIKNKFNGQIIFDGAIQSVAINALVNFNDDSKVLLSGTFCNLGEGVNGEKLVVLPDSANKGADCKYAIISKEAGYYKGYDKTNTDINYYYLPDGVAVKLIRLLPGMRFWIKVSEDVVIGDLLVNNYTANVEYQAQKAVAGDTAFLQVENSAKANGLAQVIVVSPMVVA